MTQIALDLVDLHKRFTGDVFRKPHEAIRGLSAAFEKGKCTGFLGHNGAGKTTSLRIIFGLIRANKGRVLFDGRPIRRSDMYKIGYMPETNKLPGKLTPREILKYQSRVFGLMRSDRDWRGDIERRLDEVNLLEHQDKKVESLSKGMGRRLAWAQANIHNPEIIILDEPFSGVDPLGRRLISDLIQERKLEGKTIILCTHELWTVGELCDDFYIVKKGQVVFSSAKSDGTYGQTAKLTVTGCKMEELETLKSARKLPSWDSFHQRGFRVDLGFNQYGSASQWLRACMEQGLVITQFSQSPNFDDERILEFYR